MKAIVLTRGGLTESQEADSYNRHAKMETSELKLSEVSRGQST
ncbi:MAG TPA: hypothetical protein PLC16_11500 [Defluviitaleaceae bacterium]|nr:hypothetical protein [Defluviitaleaceae bacterium]